MPFNFPPEEELKKVIMNTRELVWKNDINEIKIEDWLSNFKGDILSIENERKLALWMLSHFVYYNEYEVEHLCKVLMKKFVHQVLIKNKTTKVNQSTIDNILSKTRFVSLGKPSESGGLILYLFRLANDLQVKLFSIPTNQNNEDIKYIVFLDDITITGGSDGQAFNYLKNFNAGGKEKFLLTFIASDESVCSLNEIGIDIITAIRLDNRNKCFFSDSYIFNYYKEHIDLFKSFALHYGRIAKNKIPLGYNDSELLFGFYYNTPDNTLPIFWGQDNNWVPIFKRVDKNYFRRVVLDERYI